MAKDTQGARILISSSAPGYMQELYKSHGVYRMYCWLGHGAGE
jgi:hypothetical protein